MGMPTYGQSFSLASNRNNGLNAPTYGGGEAGDATRSRGFLSYYEVSIISSNEFCISYLITNALLSDLPQSVEPQLAIGPRPFGKDGSVCLQRKPVGVLWRSRHDQV